jgi:suppressor for copper-sensitivity B
MTHELNAGNRPSTHHWAALLTRGTGPLSDHSQSDKSLRGNSPRVDPRSVASLNVTSLRAALQRCCQLAAMITSCLVLVASGTPALAQAGGKSAALDFGQFGLPSVPLSAASEPIELEASIHLDKAGDAGTLTISARLQPGWHVYSVTQADGGPLPTRISLESSSVQLAGAFTSDAQPHVSFHDAWPGVAVEEHEGAVTWTAPIRIVGVLDAANPAVRVLFDGLVCTNAGQCVPVDETLSPRILTGAAESPDAEMDLSEESSGGPANLLRESPPPSAATPVAPRLNLGFGAGKQPLSLGLSNGFRAEDVHATLSAAISPERVAPGGEALLSITLTPDPGYHVYPFHVEEGETKFRTLIIATETSGLSFGLPRTDARTVPNHAMPEVREHPEAVTWQVPVRVPANAPLGTKKFAFAVGFQTCTDTACDAPAGARLEGELVIDPAAAGVTGTSQLTISEMTFRDVASQPQYVGWADPALGGGTALAAQTGGQAGSAALTQPERASLTLVSLCLALAGGFILNFMPCVLPVIGLKVMGFVEQSGSRRSEIIKLNLAYVLGILSVMWTLATVTVLLGNAFGWGEQFTFLEFKVGLAALVLAMSLSFLGVWEIPIPGFATSYKSNQMMQKEGLAGAFSKGLLTTVLATPCSGPLLGVVFGLTLTLSPAGVFAVYSAVGLGMGLPFLLLCIWPDAIRVLPKPGAWMETLKEVLAFPLLLTVVYLVGSISSDYRIATLSMLIAVWFACWLIGKVPSYESFPKKARAWGAGLATLGLWGYLSFTLFGPINSHLPWQPYSPQSLAALRSSGKTVMVDFTANWCLNCQVNSRIAIERPGVAEIVRKNNVVPLLADWTDRSPVIRQQLAELKSKQIPLLAIFPADPTAEPIVLPDLLTEQMVIDALKQAGPSRTPGRMTGSVEPVKIH